MNRRNVLKALGALPLTAAWAGCGHGETAPAAAPAAAPSVEVKSVQVLLEGPFAVVLQRKSRRLIAFIPRPDPARFEYLGHHFYFNDPTHPEDTGTIQQPKEFQFVLPVKGLEDHSDPKVTYSPYVNADFNDFRAETQLWKHPPSVVSVDLPFPESINFGGRPINVKFARKGAKPGKMPTNYIIEYNVKDAEQIGMACEQMGGRAQASPNCPPGILRYFFGVRPLWMPSMKPPQGYAGTDHGAAFFNFMLDTCFPLLKAKFALQDDSTPAKDPRSTRPTAFGTDEAAPALVPAVMQSTFDRPRLQNVLALTDCAEGGIIVETDVAASRP